MKSILDPTFRYVPSARTDIRKTFARLRRQQQHAQDIGVDPQIEQAANVLPILPRRAARAGH